MSNLQRILVATVTLSLLSTLVDSKVLAQRKSKAPAVQSPQVAEINKQIRMGWQDAGLKPSQIAADGEWCRRIYLDVIGRIPSLDEMLAFVSDKSSDKREKLVNTLLYDEKYTEEYARNWTTIWTTILIGRNGGNENNSLTNRVGMQKYLRDSFARNKPYDQMVKELISATGSTVPGTEGYNGATNFLINKVNDENAAQATAATARIFLGLQVQCTQCHNHPFNDWKQRKYWEFNAFFRQTRALRQNDQGMMTGATLIDQDYVGQSGQVAEADLFYEERNGTVRVAFPVFVDGQELPKSGYVKEVNRREQLANLVIGSKYLARTQVNRVWGHFLGYGFTKPVDDMGPHNPPSHPELVDYLAAEFEKANFNQKELMKWIVLSEAYSLSSQITNHNESDNPEVGEKPKFSHFYLRQMQAEELYESLMTATGENDSRGSYEEQERRKADWLRQFIVAFGTDDGQEATSFDGTIPQVLMMFNGELVKSALDPENGNFMDKLVKHNSDFPQKNRLLFLAGLGREPTKNESEAALKLLQIHRGDPIYALQDMWWAILNSNEFIFNH